MRKIVNTKKMVDDLLSKPLHDPTTYELKLIASYFFSQHKKGDRFGIEACKNAIKEIWPEYELHVVWYYQKLDTAVAAAKRKPEVLIETHPITFTREEIEWFENFEPYTDYDPNSTYEPKNIKKYIPAQQRLLWTVYCWYKIQIQYRNQKGAMKFDYLEDETMLQKSAQLTTKEKIGAFVGLERLNLIGNILTKDPKIQRLFMKEEWVEALQHCPYPIPKNSIYHIEGCDEDNPYFQVAREAKDYAHGHSGQSIAMFAKDVPVGGEVVLTVEPDELVDKCWKYWQVIEGKIKQVKCRVCGKPLERKSNNVKEPICDECRKKIKAEKERERRKKAKAC